MTAREAWRRVLGAVGLGRRDRDFSEELEFHRRMREADHRHRGSDAATASRSARLQLGGAAQIAESWRDQRGLPCLDALRQDVRYGFRMLRRTPGFTTAALLTLMLGIGANTAIFTVVDAVLLQPLPYTDPDRLVTVGDRTPPGFSANVGFATVVDWRERSRTFESFAMMRSWQPTLVTNGEAERVPAVRVSGNYFDTLGVRPVLGRGFTPEDDRPNNRRVVLQSDRLWRRRFNADPSVVGRTLSMNDRDYRIVGVMPASFEPLSEERYYHATAELWAPIGYDLSPGPSCRSCRHLRGFGRLKPGVTLADAAAEMNAIREQMRREHPTDYEPGVLAVVPLGVALTGQVRVALFVLLGSVGFVLLIACANVANLLLARSVTRQRELALRAVLGASRGRIARQLLTESLMLSAGGAIAGVALASAAVRGLATLAPVALPRLDHAWVDGRVLVCTAIVAIGTGLAFGLAPAWCWRGAKARAALAVDSRGSVGGHARARSVLVVVDLALALVLLAGAGLMLRTVEALTRTDPGFAASGVQSMQFSFGGKAYATNEAVVAFDDRAVQKLRAIPGVQGAALASQIPFGGNGDCSGFHVKDRMQPNTADDPCIERYGVTPDYMRVMGIPLRAGRTFTDADTATSQPVLVISEATARLVFGRDNPIGSQVRVGGAERGPWLTIVGVVADLHHADLTDPPVAAMYNPQSQSADAAVVVLKTAAADPVSAAAPARAVLRDLDSSIPVYGVATIASLIGKSSAQRRFVMRLLTGFAVVAVLLAAVGLYGVVSYGVTQRTREVGVRVALGAQRRDVVRLVLSSGMTLVGVGVLAGLGVSLAATRFLGTLVFGVSPTDPLTFATASAVLMLVAILAHWFPVRRALRIDPATALRAE